MLAGCWNGGYQMLTKPLFCKTYFKIIGFIINRKYLDILRRPLQNLKILKTCFLVTINNYLIKSMWLYKTLLQLYQSLYTTTLHVSIYSTCLYILYLSLYTLPVSIYSTCLYSTSLYILYLSLYTLPVSIYSTCLYILYLSLYTLLVSIYLDMMIYTPMIPN